MPFASRPSDPSARPPPDRPTPPHPPGDAPAPPEVVVLALNDHLTHLALRGGFDAAATRTIERLFTQLVPARRLSAMLDFREVTFFSSYAMCMLVMASRAIRHRGRLLVLVAPTSPIDAALRATRLHLLMPFAKDESEARQLIERHEAGGTGGTPAPSGRPFTQS
jgi:anti-anti-sigma factor